MTTNKLLENLIADVLLSSKEKDVPIKKYVSLTEKHGFHNGGILVKEKVKQTFLGIIFTSKTIDEICIKLRRVCKLRFDLDGLKSVNDIGGYRFGDILLDSVAEAFHNKRVMDFCNKFSLHIEIDRAGGDEFDIFVERFGSGLDEDVCYELFSEKFITRPVIFLLRDLIIVEAAKNTLTEVDFHSPTIQEKLGEDGCDLLRKAEQSSGEKFYFSPSVSAGECILWDALVHFIENEAVTAIHKNKLGDKLMGLVEDISGDLVGKRKVILQKTLWASSSPFQHMQAYLITRSKADKEMAILLHKLRILNKKRVAVSMGNHHLQALRECALCQLSKEENANEKAFFEEIELAVSYVEATLRSLDNQIKLLLQ